MPASKTAVSIPLFVNAPEVPDDADFNVLGINILFIPVHPDII